MILVVLMVTLSACGNMAMEAGKEPTKLPSASLVIQMLDVGQGDAILVRTNQQVILIDTGDVPTRNNLVDYLKKQGISVIDKVIITHPHADHLGGIAGVMEHFTVKQIYDSGQTTTTALYRQYLSSIKKHKIPFAVVAAGDEIDFGNGVLFRVLNPKKPFISDSELNNNSIVGKLTFGQFSMLFTGDAEKEAEDRMKKDYSAELQSTILKSPHHGSRTSSTLTFLRFVSPAAIVISVGANNEYQHPHPTTLRKYADVKAQVYRTDLAGTITITSDGQNYQIKKEKD
ncbi:MBL fold metallo-hydrolase [bacterium BFN5]|nr:MBL fold metallo-hydrolase [bacterium BFN5]